MAPHQGSYVLGVEYMVGKDLSSPMVRGYSAMETARMSPR